MCSSALSALQHCFELCHALKLEEPGAVLQNDPDRRGFWRTLRNTNITVSMLRRTVWCSFAMWKSTEKPTECSPQKQPWQQPLFRFSQIDGTSCVRVFLLIVASIVWRAKLPACRRNHCNGKIIMEINGKFAVDPKIWNQWNLTPLILPAVAWSPEQSTESVKHQLCFRIVQCQCCWLIAAATG